jgi:hypothetical protein
MRPLLFSLAAHELLNYLEPARVSIGFPSKKDSRATDDQSEIIPGACGIDERTNEAGAKIPASKPQNALVLRDLCFNAVVVGGLGNGP